MSTIGLVDFEYGTNGELFLEGFLFVQEDPELYQVESLRPRSREERYKNFKVWSGK